MSKNSGKKGKVHFPCMTLDLSCVKYVYIYLQSTSSDLHQLAYIAVTVAIRLRHNKVIFKPFHL